jgi:uncharacterized protein YbjT (DUF2867 family)
MKVILFGATGMVGQGVLRECLLDPDVESILSVGRNSTGQHQAKLHEIVLKDIAAALPSIGPQLRGYDACFFCLGVSAVGMSERDYSLLTYDLTVSVATALVKLNPTMTFVYVSGANTDGSGRSRMMWARVKGKTENAILDMPFKAAYMFRPGYIQPLHGIRTKTKLYGALYAVMAPLYPLWKRLLPAKVTTTEALGRAMIRVAKQGYPTRVLETSDINALAASPVAI